MELPEGLVQAGTAHVVDVIDGDTVVFADGSEGRLVGIQAPKLALGRRGFVDWPLAAEAHAALRDMALDRDLVLAFGGTERDRYGRWLAHLFRAEDGLWLQGEMLRLGLARVYSFPDNRAAVAALLALERDARAAELGIWALPAYAIRAPEETDALLDRFEIVEGVVLDAAAANGRVYLNFGADWRTDFTVSIAGQSLALFAQAGLDPLALERRRIRVRGWIERYNGPTIEATHPEQVELPAGE
jgi:endonuclease YncB( thermonuclease family)